MAGQISHRADNFVRRLLATRDSLRIANSPEMAAVQQTLAPSKVTDRLQKYRAAHTPERCAAASARLEQAWRLWRENKGRGK
jgi:hypothetical protein